MRIIYEPTLYVSATNNGFEIGLYTKNNVHDVLNLKEKTNLICSGKCSGKFFQKMKNLYSAVWNQTTMLLLSELTARPNYEEIKINILEESRVNYKATAYDDMIFLKIFFNDADNLIKALQIIKKISKPEEKFKENILEKATAFTCKDLQLNEISRYSTVSKEFRRFFTRENLFGSEDILGLPEGCATIVESFLAYQSNLGFFREQIRTCGLKSKISKLIPENSFTITIHHHDNSNKTDPKNNPNIIIKFQNDAHAQLIVSKLMISIYTPKSLYRPVKNSTTLQIYDPKLTIAKKIGSGEYNHILFPKQSYKQQEPSVNNIETRMDMNIVVPSTFDDELLLIEFDNLINDINKSM